MASKKKLNGCRTVLCVEEAAHKCGCTTHEFFIRALRHTRLDGPTEWEAFQKFKKDGVAFYPNYTLPQSVIRLAEEAHASRSPRNFFKKLSPLTHSPASVSA